VVLLLPTAKVHEVYFFFGTLPFALAAGASAATAGGLVVAPLLGAGAPLPAVGGGGLVVGAPVLTTFLAAAIICDFLEKNKCE